METKRCANCHKLQRADAQACSRCGHIFVPKKSRPTRAWTQPSIPPASPHRAGHYSGLHPEDQPYLSNKIAIHHPPLNNSENQRASLPEPEHIVLPVTDPALRRRIPLPQPYGEHSVAEFPIIEAPVLYAERSRWHLPRPAIPVLLAISCIFFVLASSILAVVLIRKSAPTTLAHLATSPSTLRANDTLTVTGSKFTINSLITFTYDNNQTLSDANRRPLETQTDGHGTFSLQLRIPNTWVPGQHTLHATDATANLSVSTTITVQQPPEAPPALRLFSSNLSFGMDAAGVSSDKTITLLNNGGGQITWRANSDQPWLTASPNNGVFSGRQNVRVIVNRTALTPASYTGHIAFLPEGNSSLSPLTITVTMGVEAFVSSALAISPSSLPFSMVTGQQPVLKAIILTNNSNQALTWNANASTSDQGHWLSAAPATGTLDPGVEGYMNAQVDVQGLSPGSYQGTLTFSSGAGGITQEVLISLIVS